MYSFYYAFFHAGMCHNFWLSSIQIFLGLASKSFDEYLFPFNTVQDEGYTYDSM